MDDDQRARLTEVLSATDGAPLLTRFCQLCVEILEVTGAGISIVNGNEHQGAIAASDEQFTVVDELQFALGEGPTIDAIHAPAPILEPDLERAAPQWPAFVPHAGTNNVVAHFAFPLRIGAADVGVLSLHRDRTGDLSDQHVRDALELARIAVHLVLELQTDGSTNGLAERLRDVGDHRSRVHQATGMIAAQLETDVRTAISRLRAHAWAHDKSIDDVAMAVIRREIRFDDSRG